MERGGRLIAVLVIVLMVISFLWAYDYLYGPKQAALPLPPLPSFVQSTQNAKILIIDMNADQRPDLGEVFSGEDAILMIHQGDDPFNHQNDNVYANDILLKFFDQNKDGRIDANDSVYKRLELKYYDTSRRGFFGFTPVAQAGIRAIYIDPKYYSKFGAQDLSPRPIGTAIMADGTARLIRQVIVDESYLNPQSKPVAAPTPRVEPTTAPVTTPAAPTLPAPAATVPGSVQPVTPTQ